MKIAVVGLGGSGVAALRFLVMAGHEVTGYEQFHIGHEFGSSHGHSRIIRRSYPDAFHTGMMGQAYPLWFDLEQEQGSELFSRCGGLTFGPAGDATVEQTRLSLSDAGISYELLDREETATRFPAIDIGVGATAIFQQDSGFLRATRCVLAQADLARSHGAKIQENSAVTAIEENAGRALVSTAGETTAFDAVIVTAGPWMGKLLADLHLPLRTALRQVVYLATSGNDGDFLPDKLPVWIEHPSDFYGFPQDGEIPGIKIASHDAGVDFDPGRAERPIMTDPLQRVVDHAMKRFPGISGEAFFAQSCLYTITPDERFILDFAPGSQRLVICSGCSGHGFKFTILLGKIAAALATTGDNTPSPAPWRLGRFVIG